MKKEQLMIEQIEEYLKKYNPLNLGGARVELINIYNHLHYRIEKDGKNYCFRMINQESYRAGEWLTIAEEYTVLKRLERSRLGPKAFYVDPERFELPLMIQEFVSGAVCFKSLDLTRKHLEATAEAIALLNSQNITPENFSFREGFTRYSYLTSVKTWRRRLVVIKKSENQDVLEWAKKIEDVVDCAEKVLDSNEPLLQKALWSFNFDGAHVGNTYWKDNRVIFLDWQKVSYGDPAFTLVRFLTSVGKDGEISDKTKEIMLDAYLKKRDVPGFVGLFNQRLFERQVADLVWVVWHYVNEKRTEPVENTGVVSRYERVKKLLA